MKKKIVWMILSCLMVAAPLLVSCTTAVTEEEETTPTADIWLDLLRLIPIESDTLQFGVVINDLHALRTALGIPLPAPDASAEELWAYKLQLLGADDLLSTKPPTYIYPDHFSGLDKYFNPQEWQQTVGFTLANVDQTIYAGAPPLNFQAVRGRFDENTIDQAVRTGPMNDLLEDISYKGIEYYSWGGDNEIVLARRSGVRPLGRGHRMALIDDYILWTVYTDSLKKMADSYQGSLPSLATVEEYQLLVQGLAELGTYTALFASPKSGPLKREMLFALTSFWEGRTDDEVEHLLRKLFEDSPLLEPYQVLAAGVGLDEQGYFMGIVLVHTDSEAARQNVRLLEQRLKEAPSAYTGEVWINQIEDMEIKSQGRLTLAKLYGDIARNWFGFYEEYDPLLLHK
ncbi:hypothetical protein ACFLXU_02645 [Chloroflexota bacterium]